MGAANGEASQPATGHMLQLDGLRALAVLAVVLHHTLPDSVTRVVDLGGYGVQLFFVLSGFLITGILLKARQEAEQAGVGRPRVLRAFYARRFLRIFPLYYAVLLIAYCMHAPGIREGIFWFVSYLANFYYALEGTFSGAGSHLWSLAVEEQFYLCWPILVLFLPRRLLPWLLGATILVGPSSRLVVALLTGGREVPTRILTTSCLDALGAGAFLAWLWQAEQASIALRTRLGRLALATGAGLLLAFYTLQTFHVGAAIRLIAGGTGSALVFGWVINRAAGRDTGPAGWLLECRPIVYLGTISYGMYVYQNFIIWGWFTTSRGLGQFLSVFVITAAVAAVSWHFFEKPLNNLKRFFPYLPSKLAGPEANAAGLAPQACALSRQ